MNNRRLSRVILRFQLFTEKSESMQNRKNEPERLTELLEDASVWKDTDLDCGGCEELDPDAVCADTGETGNR